jgi:formate-dependent phosphoribosylglycinamide formyltransferase (GAR transformylase)
LVLTISDREIGQVHCRWRVKAAELVQQVTKISRFNILDIIFRTAFENGQSSELRVESLHDENTSQSNSKEALPKNAKCFMLSHLEPWLNHPETSELAIKLLIPAEKGYVVRSNILQQRMSGCERVGDIQDFCNPFDELDEVAHTSLSPVKPETFQALLHCASGGMVVRPSKELSAAEALDFVDSQLAIRMSIPWLSSSPPSRQMIVAIGSHRVQSMETFYDAAQSLGIEILLVASKDDKVYSHCRDEIVTVDMTLDDGLVSRIVEALKSQRRCLSGVVAYRDHLLVTAAKVAEELGLPTSPPSAVETCVNKHAMRLRTMANCSQMLYAEDLNHLKQLVTSLPQPLEFPLVVKPSEGQGSVGVSKVTNTQQLYDAVTGITNYGQKSGVKSGVIVETYIDGPEVDANFVMLDGEVLFSEVVDNFPCTADDEEDQQTDSFLERDMVYPSGLSEPEIAFIKSSIQRLLVEDLGFQTGVFHVEGRICGSSMEYKTQDGIIDLHSKQLSQAKPPSVFILEVNARCPGVAGVPPTAYTYGVDLAALWLLTAVRDSQRLRALSRSFLNGAELWCDLVPITVTRGGTLESDDIMEELRQRRPDLMATVFTTTIFYRYGDVVPEPSVTNLSGIIAEFVCFSRKSRADLLGIVKQIREEVRIRWR